MSNNYKPGDWRIFCIIVGLFALVWSAALILTAGEAGAVTSNAPYGGCKEVVQVLDNPDMLHSDGANYCRRHGWIVRKNVVVSPFAEATTDLPKCTQEDSTHCYWNALRRGNHLGQGYVSLKGRLIRVDFINGKRAAEHIIGYYAIVPNGI